MTKELITIEKEKLRRVSKPKVRTGCLTCKNRRVKCDEGKPVCSRCERSRYTCKYKSVPTSICNKEYVAILPYQSGEVETTKSFGDQPPNTLPTKNFTPPLPQICNNNPSCSIAGNEQERQYFCLFRDQISVELCGHFEAPFWTRLILQECHHEPSIRHEILALSGLYKSLTRETEPVNATDEHHQFALAQQSKALTCLRERLSGKTEDLRLALIASLVFGSFESFYGNCVTAMQQMCSALTFMKHYQKAHENKISTVRSIAGAVIHLDTEISTASERLELLLSSYCAMNPACDYLTTELDNEIWVDDIPDRFSTLEDGFSSAKKLTMRSFQYIRHSRRYKLQSQGNYMRATIVLQERDELKLVLQQWNAAFDNVFHEVSNNSERKDSIGALQLRSCALMVEIAVHTSIEEEETVYDSFLGSFQYITSSSRCILQRDRELMARRGPRLQFGLGLIMSLFFVATRCRNSLVRHEAIAILQEYPSRNGIWSSLQAITVAKWVIKLEEDGSNVQDYIPESCRVRMHTLKWDTHEGKIKVECMHGGGLRRAVLRE